MDPKIGPMNEIGICFDNDLVSLCFRRSVIEPRAKKMRLTYSNDQHIRFVWIDGDEIRLHDGEIVSINPKFVCQETTGIYESNLVLLALLKDDFVSLFLSCTTIVRHWIAGKKTFAIQCGRYREWSVW